MNQTNESSFEAHVEEMLLGPAGWKSGTNAEWDQERALFPARIISFLQDTQAKLWAQMQSLHGDGLEPMLMTEWKSRDREIVSHASVSPRGHHARYYPTKETKPRFVRRNVSGTERIRRKICMSMDNNSEKIRTTLKPTLFLCPSRDCDGTDRRYSQPRA